MTGEVLSLHEAARRVHRSRRTIQRWLRHDLPHFTRPGDPTKWVRLEDLQAAFVRRLEADPARPRDAAHLEHGTIQRYWNGCRCIRCSAARSNYLRTKYADNASRTAERRNNFARNGVTP